MTKWLDFETKIFEYLVQSYGTSDIIFEKSGKSDSNAPDISVFIKGDFAFNIELKMPKAQCGQFVLFPNVEKQNFEYSSKNGYPINSDSMAIIEFMNIHFEEFNNAGTKGNVINLDKSIFYSWIKNYYKSKGVKFFITEYHGSIVVFGVDIFEKYFDVSATYRIKKRGSSVPSLSNHNEILNLLDDPSAKLEISDGKVILNTSKILFNTILEGKKYSYIFRLEQNDIYLVRRLSNTYNSNIIFTIMSKREQDIYDLDDFIKAIN